MSKLFRKRIVFPIIGAVALVFSLVWALVSTPKTYAASTLPEETELLIYIGGQNLRTQTNCKIGGDDDNYVQYDESNRKLTFKNFTYQGSDAYVFDENKYAAVYIKHDEGWPGDYYELDIDFIGENKIVDTGNTGDCRYGFYYFTNENTDFNAPTDDGSFSATAGQAISSSIGFYFEGRTTILDSNLSITGIGGKQTATSTTTYRSGSYGIYTNYDLDLFKNDEIIGYGGNAALDSYGVYYGDLIESSITSEKLSSVTGVGGNSTNGNSYGVGCNGINFKNKANISGTAGNAKKSSYGIYIFGQLNEDASYIQDSSTIIGTGGTAETEDSIGIYVGESPAAIFVAKEKAKLVALGGKVTGSGKSVGMYLRKPVEISAYAQLIARGDKNCTESYGIYSSNTTDFYLDIRKSSPWPQYVLLQGNKRAAWASIKIKDSYYGLDGIGWLDYEGKAEESRVYANEYNDLGEIDFSTWKYAEKCLLFTENALVAEPVDYNGRYDAEPHTGSIIVWFYGDYTIKYGLEEGTYNLTEMPTFTEVGNHKFYYQVSWDKTVQNFNLEPAKGAVEVNITKEDIEIVEPGTYDGYDDSEFTYDGSQKQLVKSAGLSADGHLEYSLNQVDWTTDWASLTTSNAGYTKVYYKVVDFDEMYYNDPGVMYVNAYIEYAELSDISITLTTDNITYTGEPITPTVTAIATSVNNQPVTFKYSLDFGDYGDMPSLINVGTYTINVMVEAPNHKSSPRQLEVEIKKAEGVIQNPPTAKEHLMYEGSAVELINAGSSADGKIYYSLDNNSYSEDIPTATEIGSYNVYYYLKGDSNHLDTDPQQLTAEIIQVDKTYLNDAINTATTYWNSIKDNTKYATIASTLKNAIDEAQSVADSDGLTGSQVNNAISAINDSNDHAHGGVVDVLINDLGNPEYTDTYKNAINAVKGAYNDLTPAQQAYVGDKHILTAKDDTYKAMDLINSIGQIAYDDASKDAIDAAREAYNNLPAGYKGFVSNYSSLTDAEEAYNELFEENAEAYIGNTFYPTLVEAFAAFNAGDTIILNQDVDLSNENIEINKNVTIDLNGHILTTSMEDGNSGTPTLFVSSNNTIFEIRNSKPATGGLNGLVIVDVNAVDSYVKVNDCRFVLPADIINNADTLKVGPGYEAVNINADGSADENGFVSIVKPLDVFDISNLDEDYIVPDGQILTGDLQNPVKISILDGATVTLKDLSINSSQISFTDENFAGITCLGDAELIIKGNNDVFGFNGGAGIFVPEGHTLTIDGDGILYSDGRDGAAGIGGNANTNSGNIIINGGDINADGGAKAAGIGGGYSEDNDLQSGNITINGGRINSTGSDGAGIGSAMGEACGDITINGGVVEAKSSNSSSTDNCGSGIGSGKDGSCGAVAITDNVALVRATAKVNGKEIGGNYASLDIANTLTFERIYESIYYSHKNTVIIDGQVVNDSHSSGKGWSYDKDTNTLTLDGYVYEGPGKVYSNFTNFGGIFIAAISYEGEDDFTINLVGENTIVVTQDDSPFDVCGIHSAGKESAGLKFIGNGSLSISFTGDNSKSYAIAAGSSVTIDGPTIVANGGNAINESAGIYVRYDGLNVISGSLTATASECSGSHNESYGINSTGSKITIGENTKSVIASGYRNAISYETVVINAIEGIGWTDVAGTEGETAIEVSTTGAPTEGFKYISFIGITPEDVIAFINDIGDVEYTDLCKEKIDKARDAYNFLKDDEKAIVTNYDTLLAAEENYGKVDEVVGKINAIGDVEYTPESKALIDAARTAYDALTDFQKSLVPNLDTLVAKETEYKALDDQHHADEVGNIINNIGEVKYTPESKALIDAARTAFDALNDEAKELVENKAVLLAAENVYATMDLINSLDSVKYNSKSKALIEKAKELYNELTDSEKELITNYNGLVKADDDYKAVDKVVKEISNLGKITYDEASLNKINNAKKSKSALSTDQQKIFPSNATEVLKDYEVAYDTLETFNSLGEVEYTKEYEKELADARVKYNSLTDDQKKLIDDTDLKLLTDKENQFKSTEKAATIWGVILLILSIVALGSGCYFLFLVLRKKDEDDEKKDNTVKATSSVLPLVILTSYFATGPYLAFYIIISLAVAVWAAVLVIYLLKKKGIMMASNTNTEVETENIPEVEETETGPTEEVLAEEKEEIQETQPENTTDDSDESDEEQVVETTTDASGNIFKIQYISSFTAKLIQSSDEIKRQYSELRKEVLSYSGTKSKTTWHFDTISYGRTVILRFGIRGKTLCVYYALNYEDFENSKYKLENVTSKKHSSAPCLYRIKNDRRFDYAKELIEILAKKYDLIKEEKEIEDIMPPYEDRDTLVSKGLIKKLEVKLTSNDKKITEITVDEANKAMSNDAALGCVITDNDSKIHEGKKEVVNVSVLEEQYNDGDTVNIESLIEKGIINSNVGYVKLLAGGKLDKKLNVELQDYSIEAVKMIIILGGTVKKVR